VCGERDDVDDRSGRLTAAHVFHGRLHDEERRPQIYRYVSVEELDGGVHQCSTRSNTCGVDDAVNPAEAGHGRAHATRSSERISKINSVESDIGAIACKITGKSLTRGPIAPRDHDSGRTFSRGGRGNPGAEPSSTSADQNDLALEEHRRPHPRSGIEVRAHRDPFPVASRR
jgi:hypothetical protein